MTDGEIDDEGGRAYRAATSAQRLAYLDGWEMVRCETGAKVPADLYLAMWFRTGQRESVEATRA